MTSISSQPPQLPPTTTGDTFGSGSFSGSRNTSPPLPPPINTQLHQQNEPFASVREIRDADQSTTESEINEEVEDRDRVDDSLAPPRPIGKHQPSWDPFNATPIAEEQGSGYDPRPNQQSYPFPISPTQHQPSKLLVSSGIVSKDDRTDSRDGNLHDGVEDQTSIKNDWVMVTPEAEIDKNVSKPDIPPQSIMHRARGSSYEIPILQIGRAHV